MLSDLFGSETRARVIELLLTRQGQPYHLRELVRAAGVGTSGVQRELARLARLGLVHLERGPGGRRIIRVDTGHPLLEPLKGLLAGATAQSAGAGPAAERRRAASTDVSAQVHPRLRPLLPQLLEVCRRAGVERAVLFGSAAQADAGSDPRDIDLLVRLGSPVDGRGARYFTLRHELERVGGLPVDLVEEEGVENPYLRAEIERTGVVLLEAA